VKRRRDARTQTDARSDGRRYLVGDSCALFRTHMLVFSGCEPLAASKVSFLYGITLGSPACNAGAGLV
jgi:hypothetical protein